MILQECMSEPYCEGTYFDYLDLEEKVMILKAMYQFKNQDEN